MTKHIKEELPEGMKRCTKCKVVQPATNEFFARSYNKTDKLFSQCKTCTAEYGAKRYLDHREIMLNRQIGYNHKEGLVTVHSKRVLPGAPNTLTTAEWIECIDFFDGLDAYSGRPMIHMSMDHIKPLKKYGGHEKCNVLPCDAPLNIWKSNNDMEEWYRKEIAFFDEDRLIKIKQWMNGAV